MIEPKFLTVLQKLYDSIKDSDINWVVTGSLAFAIQGINTEIHDIDIQTDQTGVYDIERLFSEYVIKKVKFSTSEKIKSHFGALEIKGIKVELMGDIQKKLKNGRWENPVDLQKYKRIVEFNNMQIPMLQLEYEYEAYLTLGRYKKANILREWLSSA